MKKLNVTMCNAEKEALIRQYFIGNASLQMVLMRGINLDFFMEKLTQLEFTAKDSLLSQVEYSYKIPVVEVRQILKKQLQECPEDYITDKPLIELIRKDGELLFALPDDEWTDDLIIAAIKSKRSIYKQLPSDYQNRYFVKHAVVSSYPFLVKNLNFTEDELVNIIAEQPVVFTHLPTESVTQKLLYMFLEQYVKTDFTPNTYYWGNIPDELKDRVYYQSRAMANPFYLHEVPDEYKSQRLYEYCFEHMFDKPHSYTYPLSLLDCLPDSIVTEEVALKCCENHFAAVEKIPRRFKNDDFYRKLMDNGMYNFICCVDLTTISPNLVEECLRHVECQFWFWHEKFPKNFWTSGIVKEYAKVSNMFFKHVPVKMITKEDAVTNLVRHKSFDEFPKKFLDADVVDVLMTNAYGIIDKISSEYKTKEFYAKHIANHNMYFKDIPQAYITSDIVFSYIKAGKSIPFEKIPQTLITKDMIRELYVHNSNYHFSQGNQSPQITKWIYEVMLEADGINVVKNNLYMLSHITRDVFMDLCETIPANVLFSRIISSYINEEMCDIAYEKDPRNILYFPESLKEKYRQLYNKSLFTAYSSCTMENAEHIGNVTEVGANASDKTILYDTSAEAESDMTETFVQLSLFDLFELKGA